MYQINWLEFCGWMGCFLYSIFSIPQLISVIKKGKTYGLNGTTLLLMSIGSLFSLICVFPQKKLPLIVNFTLTLISSFIMLCYKIGEHKK